MERKETIVSETQEQENLVKKNILGTMPEGPLLMRVSLPIVLSMLVQALYNIIDSIFVARLGEDALAAVGLVFSVQNLMIAVAVGTGVGIASRLGRRLGEQNVESANRVVANGLFLSLLNWLLFVLIGVFGTRAYMAAFADGSQQSLGIAAMGAEYMYIVTIGSLGIFFAVTLERFLQATGRTMYSMVAQMAGAIINIILDPIMIFGLLGFPAMGVAGAALATVIGQWVGMGIGLLSNIFRNPEIQIQLRGFRPSAKTIKHIYQVGVPSIVMQSIGSVMTFFMNKILVDYSTTAVSVFSVYFKLQSFVFMPVFGFNNGMVSIVSFNFGARRADRIGKTIRICMLSCLCIMVLGALLFWFAPQAMLRLFDASENMLAVGVPALRTLGLCFPLAAISIVISGVFQAVGRGIYSLFTSMIRQLFVLLPLAWVFSNWFGLNAIWYSFVVAEVVCIVAAVIFFRRVWKQDISPLAAGSPPK